MFRKRVFSVVLVAVLIAATLPVTALADVTFNSSAASMSTPRGYYPGAAVIDSNHILVYGGSNPTYNAALSSAEIYTISSNSFSSTASMPTTRRYNATNTATLSDGTVVVVGGYSTSSPVSAISLYKNGSWSNAPVSLKTARCWHTTTKLKDGRILIAGGKNGSTYLKSVEIYDPSNNTITYAASMNYYHSAGAATLLKDGRVLVAGGDTNGDSRDTLSEIYDPETNTWETISRYPEPGRAGLILVTLDSGIVMLMGGNSGTDGSSGAETSTYYYYPEKSGSSAWEAGPSMSGVAKSRAAYAMVGDTVYIIGGGSNSSNFEATVTTATINEPKLASVSGLSVSPGSLSPSYNQEKIQYDAGEASDGYKYSGTQSSISVKATSTNGSIYINNQYTSSGSARSVSLNKGENTIYVDVKDNDNIVRRYTLDAYRKYESTVTYNINCSDGTGTLPVDNNKYEPDDNATVKSGDNLSRDGYRFKCWGTSPTGGTQYNANNLIKMGESSITLYAQWIKTYDVTYYGNENTSGTAPVDGNSPYDANAQVTVLGKGTLDRTGFDFDGWNTMANGGGTGYTESQKYNISSDMELYAQWDRITYKFEFDSRGGDSVAYQTVNHGDKATKPSDPEKIGYDFGGWYTATNFETQWDFDDVITSATKVYAKWTPSSGTKYTIKYFHQNIEDDDYSAAEVVEESGTTEEEVTIPEKSFVGFEENLTHADRLITDKIKADGSLVLARYYNRNVYSVTFAKNTEEDVTDMPAEQNIRYDGKVTEPTSVPIRVNYTFGGWYKEAECTNAWDFDNDTVKADTELFAKWGINERVITYDKNGGDAGDSTATIEAGSVFELDDGATYSREGYLIEGWTIEETPYKLGALYTMPDKDVTASAIWVADSDGDGVSDEDEIAAGTNPNNGNDAPQKGTIIFKLLSNDGSGNLVPIEGLNCVLNSQPVSVITDAGGNATFNNVSLAQHSLSIRENNVETGVFTMLFTRGDSNNVTTDPATGTIMAQVAGNFLTLNVTIEQDASGAWVIGSATHTELAPQIFIENPKTGDDSHGALYYLAWLFGVIVLIGSSVVAYKRKMIKE